MNLYNLHSEPMSLNFYELISETNPDIFWEKYKNKPEELKKREKYMAANAIYAYHYAKNILEGPFPPGEEAIAKDEYYAYYYAKNILKGPFPAGEEAISKDTHCFKLYVKFVLKKDFYFNGKLITKYNP